MQIKWNSHISGDRLIAYISRWKRRHLTYRHYCDVIMDTMNSQITSLTIVYLTVYSDADQRKHQNTASLAFVRGIHRRPVTSPQKWPVTRKMFPFDDVIMGTWIVHIVINSVGLLSHIPVHHWRTYWLNCPNLNILTYCPKQSSMKFGKKKERISWRNCILKMTSINCR